MNVPGASVEESATGLAQWPAPSRRARKKERTRREIYDAAVELIVAHGFAAVTIEDICRAADVAKGTFFLHFPTKDAVLFEYGQRANEELAAMLHRHRGSAASALRAALRMLAERAVRHPALVHTVVRETLARPQLIETNSAQSRDLAGLLAATIRRGQANGEFRRGIEPLVAGATVAAAFLAFIYEWTRREGKLEVEAALVHALDIVLNGLNHRKGKRA